MCSGGLQMPESVADIIEDDGRDNALVIEPSEKRQKMGWIFNDGTPYKKASRRGMRLQ